MPPKPSPKKPVGKTPAKTGTKPAPAKTGTAVKKPVGKLPAGKKASNTTTAVKPEKQSEKTAEKKWTPQDDAANKIQTEIRRFLAKKALQRKRKEKQDYEELMEKLEREAYIKVAKMQQEQAQMEAEKDEEERKRRREMTKRKKRMLEAAFDGDNDEIMQCLKEVREMDDKMGVNTDVVGKAVRAKHQLSMVDCEDANENTPLSEGASGGHVDTINLLIEKGANVNAVGQFGRTPLYRAAFAGHLEAVEILLQNGADPRIYAADSQTSEQVASIEAIAQFLQGWDISLTENLLLKIEKDNEKKAEEQKKGREAQMEKIEEQIKEAQKDCDMKQKLLNKAYCELEKRITEHDTAIATGYDRPDLTEQIIHDQEGELEIIKIQVEEAQQKLANLKLKLREQQLQNASLGEDLPGLKVNIRELDDVIMKDVGNKIRDSGKCILIIDKSGQAATFLRYRDTNYLNALSPSQMEPNKVRMAILGAIRYGKPVVMDMMEVDMFDTCVDRFDEVQKGFMNMILDRSILKEENYMKVVKNTDGTDYDRMRFMDSRTKNFQFIIVTKNPYPSDELVELLYVIRIVLPD